MLSFPNAKINIGLFITERRPDGYHNLETIFYPIQACKDALEIIPSSSFNLQIHGKKIQGNNKNNLISKAFEVIASDFPQVLQSPIKASLIKKIPMGAGLGGGSSDGAFMLKLLNDYYQLNLSKEALIAYALQLGSDCPFFIMNEPCLATGRGEKLKPITIDLSQYSIQLICPNIHISTATAFHNIKPRKAPFDLQEIHSLPIESWKENIYNDFENNIFLEFPALHDVVQQLYKQGAIYAAMSGTGSTLYGIFPKGEKATIECAYPFETFYEE